MTETDQAWREYERQVHDALVSLYPKAEVVHDAKLEGNLSAATRQIDVLLTEKFQGKTVRTAVEAKHFARRIDVKQVEAFIGLLHDIRVDRGLMVSPLGYSKAAYDRAFRDNVDVDLDVFSLAELREWQSEGAIPYAARTAIALPAPLGWVIESRPTRHVLAALYRRGFDFETATKHGEWMYLNIWNRQDAVNNLDLLLEMQERDILKLYPDAQISISDFAHRSDARTCLRRAEISEYPSAELTGFVEFPLGILYVVLFGPLVVERRNLRKLEYILQKVIPMEVHHSV